MDEIDGEIVRRLQADARQTNRDLAAALGIAPSTCLERVRSLRRRGVITGFHASVDPAALGRGLRALIAVQARPLSRDVIDSFKRHVSAWPEVVEIFVLTGTDDFLVHVAVRDIDALHAFLMDRFTRRKEIVSFRTSVVYQHLRTPALTELPTE
jgi:DNA-binding Lrp family transcriptional regulator